MQELYEGIYALFDAGNTLKTALAGRLYPHEGLQESTFPYGVYFKIYGGPIYNFTQEREEIGVQFSFYSDDSDPEEANTLYGYCKDLYDDSRPTITGYTLLKFERVDDNLVRDELQGTWGYHIDYVVWLERLRP
jgi:hypothetical protein